MNEFENLKNEEISKVNALFNELNYVDTCELVRYILTIRKTQDDNCDDYFECETCRKTEHHISEEYKKMREEIEDEYKTAISIRDHEIRLQREAIEELKKQLPAKPTENGELKHWAEETTTLKKAIYLKKEDRVIEIAKIDGHVRFMEQCDDWFTAIYTKDEALELVEELKQWILNS